MLALVEPPWFYSLGFALGKSLIRSPHSVLTLHSVSTLNILLRDSFSTLSLGFSAVAFILSPMDPPFYIAVTFEF